MRHQARVIFAIAAIASFFAFVEGAFAERQVCPNERVRSDQGTVFLPECRAYEKVSPAQKNSYDVSAAADGFQVAPGGDAVVYHSYGPFTEALNGESQAYLAHRDSPDGWRTSIVMPAESGPGGTPKGNVLGFSDDLEIAILGHSDGAQPLSPGAEPDSINLYRRNVRTAAFDLLTPVGIPVAATDVNTVTQALASIDANGSHVIFQSQQQLTPDAPAAARMNLYEWSGGGIRLVGRVPQAGPVCDDAAGPACVPAAGSFAGPEEDPQHPGTSSTPGASSSFAFYTRPTMSRGGERIIFTADPDGGLYLREGTRTTRISASQRLTPDPAGPSPAQFLTATPDASVVLFASCEKLTDDASAENNWCVARALGLNGGNPDLYRYEVDSGELRDLSASASPPVDAFKGVLGISDDGSRTYFVSRAVLAPGGITGQENLYLWEEGAGARLVATVPRAEAEPCGWTDQQNNCGERKTSRVSADGRYLLFISGAQLTAATTGGVDQYYRFDAFAPGDGLACVSCGSLSIPASGVSGAGSKGAEHLRPPALRRLLSDDGRVAFETRDALVAGDSNGKYDVYLWNDGRVALLSPGTGDDDAFFADATANFNDVFFTTGERLTGADADANVDLYDARIGGGFAEPESQSPRCQGESCQGEPSPQPLGLVPGSSAVTAPVRPRHISKGKCRRKVNAGRRRCRKAHKRCGKRGKVAASKCGKRK